MIKMIHLFSFPSKSQIRSMWASSKREQPMLPQEIVVDILSRLPPKSLLKCRAVCKSWHSIISSPSFITLHRKNSSSFLLLQFCLQFHNPNTQPFLWPLNLYHRYPRRLPPLLSYSDCPLRLPPQFDRNSVIAGICNGLLCFFNTTNNDCKFFYSFFICNPSIRRFLTLPSPKPIAKSQSKDIQFIAFGFDSPNSDYKILRVVFRDDRVKNSGIEVYSLASGIWKKLVPAVAPAVAPPCSISLTKFPSHGYFNGAAHWGAKRKVQDEAGRAWWFYFLLSFDFADEVFREVALPERITLVSYYTESLPLVTVIGGNNYKNLAVYHLSGSCFPCTGSIWVMKKYGVVESWSKIFQFDLTGDRLEAPSFGMSIDDITSRPAAALCVTDDGEKLLMPLDNEPRKCLHSLDVEKKGFASHEFGVPSWKLYPDYFEETLVSLDKDKAGDKAGALVPY